ncbi:AarF/UbiB family protein [Acinetobacter baumannii]
MDRRSSIAKAFYWSGTRWATGKCSSLLSSEEEKEKKRKKAMSEQVNYLVSEIGKPKGSIVKIGQMMALYGEHFLPERNYQALNTLNNQTVALDWPAIKPHLQEQLGSKLNDLTIDHEPIGTASLAQVHRATRKSGRFRVSFKNSIPWCCECN